MGLELASADPFFARLASSVLDFSSEEEDFFSGGILPSPMFERDVLFSFPSSQLLLMLTFVELNRSFP